MAKEKKQKKADKRRKPTPKDKGLRPVALILTEELYEGMRLDCFLERGNYQQLIRKLLGDYLAGKGILQAVREGGKVVGYKLLKRPEEAAE